MNPILTAAKQLLHKEEKILSTLLVSSSFDLESILNDPLYRKSYEWSYPGISFHFQSFCYPPSLFFFIFSLKISIK